MQTLLAHAQPVRSATVKNSGLMQKLTHDLTRRRPRWSLPRSAELPCRLVLRKHYSASTSTSTTRRWNSGAFDANARAPSQGRRFLQSRCFCSSSSAPSSCSTSSTSSGSGSNVPNIGGRRGPRREQEWVDESPPESLVDSRYPSFKEFPATLRSVLYGKQSTGSCNNANYSTAARAGGQAARPPLQYEGPPHHKDVPPGMNAALATPHRQTRISPPGGFLACVAASPDDDELIRRDRTTSIMLKTKAGGLLPAHHQLLHLEQARHFARKSSGSNRDQFDRKDSTGGGFWQRVLGVGAAGYAAVKVLPGLKVAIPLLKLSKMGPLLSLVLSSFAYAYVFGWQYGLGMISLIFVHEMGHALMMRYLKVPVGPMVFLPFMGAAVEMRDQPKNATHEALIGIAGPVLGSLAAVAPFLYGLQTGSQLAFALAHWGFLINLFNLMPVGQMDGGRILGALHPGFLICGLAGNAGLIYLMPTAPMLYITLLMGCFSTYQRFFDPVDRPPGFFNIPNTQKFGIAAGYFGLVTSLVVAMQVNDHFRKSPQQLRMEQEREQKRSRASSGGGNSSSSSEETIWSYLDHVDKNYC
ncbi:unnamed protein product [Amoebophrya sp. A120]|nr:unnamed protein product [Amoebophrya sp. A120]|eukprot:GSA120T00011987001.1